MDSVHALHTSSSAPQLQRRKLFGCLHLGINAWESSSVVAMINLDCKMESSSVRVLEQTFEECGEYFASILGNQVLGKVKEFDAGHGGVVAVEVENEIVDDTCNNVVLFCLTIKVRSIRFFATPCVECWGSTGWDVIFSLPDDSCDNYGYCGANCICRNRHPICVTRVHSEVLRRMGTF
ncbi:hypothetical protein ACFX2I_007505 [Malus domestica]|uniref:Uncharacterized protein n=1 Tax=Malus domestica TaxID=3750 RepID=A0A498INH0_MALDO|nr:hypothetical protein DVH24_003529 [Malus domestica]